MSIQLSPVRDRITRLPSFCDMIALPMSHMTPDHFVEHFVDATRGTVAEGARCDVEEIDEHDPLAQSIVLESIDVGG